MPLYPIAAQIPAGGILLKDSSHKALRAHLGVVAGVCVIQQPTFSILTISRLILRTVGAFVASNRTFDIDSDQAPPPSTDHERQTNSR
ncbi:MAG: hypothetical protein OXE94_12380 [Aestuariivita sp.]|nr:hypothetical protein [Aestuariivita sp.]MCY4203562.1 hypothetical protein [Aestuariivita sp.]MCY4288898.1 hypothetical protein [Aestuariivita sp.]MCY4346139.1 hypothetical protein [Aestuariivita sp.]